LIFTFFVRHIFLLHYSLVWTAQYVRGLLLENRIGQGTPGRHSRVTFTVRTHDCPHCGLVLNRDHNAAINILARGLASVSTGPPVAVEAHQL
jgi:hypothetical protein